MKSLVSVSMVSVAVLALAACGGGDKKPAAGGGEAGKAPAAQPAGGAPAAPATGGGKYDPAKSTASVKGKVKWTGEKPKALALQISGDSFCTDQHKEPVDNERFEVAADGGLPHAFVYATEGPHKGMTGFAPASDFVLDQKGCMYHPHVFGVMVNQKFTVRNSDQTTHNVHVKPKGNPEKNAAQSAGQADTFSFEKKERAIPFVCDIHSWMSSFAFVLDHPFFATTGADGSFEVKGLPAGEYTFKVWHESFTADKASVDGEFKVTVKDGEAASAGDVALK